MKDKRLHHYVVMLNIDELGVFADLLSSHRQKLINKMKKHKGTKKGVKYANKCKALQSLATRIELSMTGKKHIDDEQNPYKK